MQLFSIILSFLADLSAVLEICAASCYSFRWSPGTNIHTKPKKKCTSRRMMAAMSVRALLVFLVASACYVLVSGTIACPETCAFHCTRAAWYPCVYLHHYCAHLFLLRSSRTTRFKEVVYRYYSSVAIVTTTGYRVSQLSNCTVLGALNASVLPNNFFGCCM